MWPRGWSSKVPPRSSRLTRQAPGTTRQTATRPEPEGESVSRACGNAPLRSQRPGSLVDLGPDDRLAIGFDFAATPTRFSSEVQLLMDFTPIAVLASFSRFSAFLRLDVSSVGTAVNEQERGSPPPAAHLRARSLALGPRQQTPERNTARALGSISRAVRAFSALTPCSSGFMRPAVGFVILYFRAWTLAVRWIRYARRSFDPIDPPRRSTGSIDPKPFKESAPPTIPIKPARPVRSMHPLTFVQLSTYQPHERPGPAATELTTSRVNTPSQSNYDARSGT